MFSRTPRWKPCRTRLGPSPGPGSYDMVRWPMPPTSRPRAKIAPKTDTGKPGNQNPALLTGLASKSIKSIAMKSEPTAPDPAWPTWQIVSPLTELGSGAVGRVLLGRLAGSCGSCSVAVKLAREAHSNADILREAHVLRNLKHPNIVHMLHWEAAAAPAKAMLALELVGDSLLKIQAENQANEADFWEAAFATQASCVRPESVGVLGAAYTVLGCFGRSRVVRLRIPCSPRRNTSIANSWLIQISTLQMWLRARARICGH